jgi:hypothetical protein
MYVRNTRGCGGVQAVWAMRTGKPIRYEMPKLRRRNAATGRLVSQWVTIGKNPHWRCS